ncbi:gag-polypeptide of LTR copia-type domain-containing protein [Phthorimaea operculella]|nr:gag-polypeptide of LTR copia-type domain-containing protein [Phthorimaea operculella]
MSASGSASVLPVEKLSGISNYGNWKFQLKMLLIHEDLWDVVSAEVGKDDEANLKRSQKALAKICLSVQPSCFTYVRNAETAHVAWNNLQKAYEDKGLSRRLSLLRLLFAMKLCECESMEAYVTRISDLSQQLSDIGSPLDDDFVAVLLLSGLPSDYDPLIMALENSNTTLSSEGVKSKLMLENMRRDEKGGDSGSATALAARRKPVRCFRCMRLGHLSRDCKAVKFNKDKDSKDSASDRALLAALSACVQHDKWLIDSGASNHMCHDKKMLNNFSPDYVSEVKVANGEKLYTSGRGNVIVKLKNSSKTIRIPRFFSFIKCALEATVMLLMIGRHARHHDNTPKPNRVNPK